MEIVYIPDKEDAPDRTKAKGNTARSTTNGARMWGARRHLLICRSGGVRDRERDGAWIGELAHEQKGLEDRGVRDSRLRAGVGGGFKTEDDYRGCGIQSGSAERMCDGTVSIWLMLLIGGSNKEIEKNEHGTDGTRSSVARAGRRLHGRTRERKKTARVTKFTARSDESLS